MITVLLMTEVLITTLLAFLPVVGLMLTFSFLWDCIGEYISNVRYRRHNKKVIEADKARYKEHVKRHNEYLLKQKDKKKYPLFYWRDGC